MGRYFVELGGFFLKPNRPRLAVLVAVLNPQPDNRTDPGEAVDHDAEQGAITKPGNA